MQLMFFTERGYYPIPEDEVIKQRSFFGLSNKYFDAEQGSRLLNEYIDDKIYCEELGFDGVALNEHHGTPYCLGAVMDVEAAVLARATKRVRIVLIGNPLPVISNPLRLAEEVAMIDLLSGGRLVPGIIRGTGCEQIFNNANPALNRELFDEAHDLMIKAWTVPGPFRFEGKHFNYRFVNPWVLPLQKPHPPIWVPGVISPETVAWCAQRRYTYVALSTRLEPTLDLWNLYVKTAAAEGYQAGPENFVYMQPVFCAETEAQAEDFGRRFLYGGGFAFFGRSEWMFPPGYNSKAATRRMAELANQRTNIWGSEGEGEGDAKGDKPDEDLQAAMGRDPRNDAEVELVKKAIYSRYPELLKSRQMIAGTPKSVLVKLRHLMRVLQPGVLILRIDGPMTREERRSCIRLLGEEVVPALREFGVEMGLDDPFTRKPGMRPLAAGAKPVPVGDASALRDLYNC
jgi:alkanesulfonate monooxygenase SsuD/methylene tetrahydromethanopterin reductase-like flavin-dependent oxidoreductase (luciferase family)